MLLYYEDASVRSTAAVNALRPHTYPVKNVFMVKSLLV
jgi:hypothetical protein